MNLLASPMAQHMMVMYIIMQLFSAVIQSIPTPDALPQGGIWYRSFYNFLSILAADFKSFQTKVASGAFSTAVQSQSISGAGSNAVTDTVTAITTGTIGGA